jgi:hypothetical protein
MQVLSGGTNDGQTPFYHVAFLMTRKEYSADYENEGREPLISVFS